MSYAVDVANVVPSPRTADTSPEVVPPAEIVPVDQLPPFGLVRTVMVSTSPPSLVSTSQWNDKSAYVPSSSLDPCESHLLALSPVMVGAAYESCHTA